MDLHSHSRSQHCRPGPESHSDCGTWRHGGGERDGGDSRIRWWWRPAVWWGDLLELVARLGEGALGRGGICCQDIVGSIADVFKKRMKFTNVTLRVSIRSNVT